MNRFLLPLLTLISTIILFGLGSWQMQRLDWKEALIAKREAGLAAKPFDLPKVVDDWERFDFRMLTLSGTFRHDLEQIVGVSARGNVVGHHVVTPLVRREGLAILVDRGWVPADKAHPASRKAGQLDGVITLAGIGRYRLNDRPGFFVPNNDPEASRWYSYDLPGMEAALGIDLAPLVIEADAAPNPGGLPIGGQTQITLANNHLQYAITWYGLAAALIGVYIVFRRQQAKSANQQDDNNL